MLRREFESLIFHLCAFSVRVSPLDSLKPKDKQNYLLYPLTKLLNLEELNSHLHV